MIDTRNGGYPLDPETLTQTTGPMEGMMGDRVVYDRFEVLQDAIVAVGKRGEDYGTPRENMDRTANILNALLADKLKHPISPGDVCMIMAGVKLARLMNQPEHHDSQVDTAGWISLMAEVA